MPTIEYKYEIDQRVVTPFGDKGIITMLGTDEGGKRYYVNTKMASNWFKEADLTADSEMKELTEGG